MKRNHCNEPKFNFFKLKCVTQSLPEFRLSWYSLEILGSLNYITKDHFPASSVLPSVTWEMIGIPVIPDMELECWDFFLISTVRIPVLWQPSVHASWSILQMAFPVSWAITVLKSTGYIVCLLSVILTVIVLFHFLKWAHPWTRC